MSSALSVFASNFENDLEEGRYENPVITKASNFYPSSDSPVIALADLRRGKLADVRREQLKRKPLDSSAANIGPNEASADSNEESEFISENVVKNLHSGVCLKTAVQEWEARVTEISDNIITARLTDITAGLTDETEETTIAINHLSEIDRTNVLVGSLLRVIIGYKREVKNAGLRRYSQITLRKLPAWRKCDLKIAQQRAERWTNAFKRD